MLRSRPFWEMADAVRCGEADGWSRVSRLLRSRSVFCAPAIVRCYSSVRARRFAGHGRQERPGPVARAGRRAGRLCPRIARPKLESLNAGAEPRLQQDAQSAVEPCAVTLAQRADDSSPRLVRADYVANWEHDALWGSVVAFPLLGTELAFAQTDDVVRPGGPGGASGGPWGAL